jgi:hypothetical protein
MKIVTGGSKLPTSFLTKAVIASLGVGLEVYHHQGLYALGQMSH